MLPSTTALMTTQNKPLTTTQNKLLTTTQNNSPSVLPNYGYQGPIEINPYEKKALDFITELEETRQPLASLSPAKQFYEELLGGAYGPTGEKFRTDVYKATETEAMKRLTDLQDIIANRFVNTGGFFGGKHAIAQGKAAADIGTSLDKLLAELNLAGFESDVGRKMEGAQGLTGLASTERGLESSLLGDILGGGQYLTGKELTNRELYQQAVDRAYQDWVRAREEKLMPFNMMAALLGMPTQQTVVEQSQPSVWSSLLQGLGTAAGTLPFIL